MLQDDRRFVTKPGTFSVIIDKLKTTFGDTGSLGLKKEQTPRHLSKVS